MNKTLMALAVAVFTGLSVSAQEVPETIADLEATGTVAKLVDGKLRVWQYKEFDPELTACLLKVHEATNSLARTPSTTLSYSEWYRAASVDGVGYTNRVPEGYPAVEKADSWAYMSWLKVKSLFSNPQHLNTILQNAALQYNWPAPKTAPELPSQ